jgi:hypothetical protein
MEKFTSKQIRFGLAILLQLIFTTLTVWADETLTVLKVNSKVYSNVTVTAVTPTDIFFTCDRGMGNVKLEDLDLELQKHFRRDATKTETPGKTQNAADNKSLAPVFVDHSNAQSIMDDAIFQVQHIVNQPVTQLKRTPDMIVGDYPGWFHPGAIKPNFNTVDVRTTQKFDYDQFPYVTSTLNPGVMFIGHDLEFNSMTKYFITDRSVPKKKLTEAEMLEINRLYRIIGHCEQQLDELQNPEPPLAKIHRLIAEHKPVVVGSMAALVVMLLLVRKRQSRS